MKAAPEISQKRQRFSNGRCVLFINDNISGNIIINKLVPELIFLEFKPVIYLLKPRIPDKAKNHGLIDFSFYDSIIGKQVIFPFLNRFSSLLKGRKEGPGNNTTNNMCYTLEQLREAYDLELYKTDDINNKKNYSSIAQDKEITGAISIRNLAIFKPETIRAFDNHAFFWNLHSGVLPQYRGAHPQFWSLLNGEKYCGLTLHEINAGIDTGKIINRSVYPIDFHKSYMRLFLEKSLKANCLITQALKSHIHKNRIPAPLNDNTKARYFSFPDDNDCKSFVNKGFSISNPVEMRDFYLSQYSVPDTRHEELLNNEIIQAIAQWERSKETATKKAASGSRRSA